MTASQNPRELYREACHGAGAEPRWQAREILEALIVESGQPMRVYFEERGFCLSSYFASRPIKS